MSGCAQHCPDQGSVGGSVIAVGALVMPAVGALAFTLGAVIAAVVLAAAGAVFAVRAVADIVRDVGELTWRQRWDARVAHVRGWRRRRRQRRRQLALWNAAHYAVVAGREGLELPGHLATGQRAEPITDWTVPTWR